MNPRSITFLCQSVAKIESRHYIFGEISALLSQAENLPPPAQDADSIPLAADFSPNKPGQLYETISESASNMLFTPEARLKLTDEATRCLLKKSTPLMRGLCPSVELAGPPEALIFGEIVVIRWRVSASKDCFHHILATDVSHIEKNLSKLGDLICACFEEQFAAKTRSNIAQNKPKNETRFISLWTSRTLCLPKDDRESIKSPWVRRWITQQGAPAQVICEDAVFSVGWGNSMIEYRPLTKIIDLYSDASAKLQYIYTKLHLINEGASKHLSHLSKSSATKQRLKNIRDLEYKFFHVNYSLMEAEYLHQGLEANLLNAYLEAWRLRRLISNIEYKLQKIRSITSELLAEKNEAIQGNIKALLMFIGSIEVLGAVVEIIDLSFSKEVREDRVFGILHLVSLENPDIIITSVLIVLISIVIASIIFGVPSTKE